MQSHSTPSLHPFIHQKTILLTSYRKSGRAVPTPVHIVVEGDHAFVRTWNTAGKFKRIRNNPEIEIAPSTMRGHPTGPAIHVHARVLSGEEAGHAAHLLARKYPLMQGILVPLSHRLLGVQTVHFELTPAESQPGRGCQRYESEKERTPMTSRPFRFGAVLRGARSKEEWVAKAKRVEQLGYSTLLVPDHIHIPLAPIPAMLMAAIATRALRIGSYVFDNDFRHPVLLAKEAATLDVLSGGRFELGLGAGWLQAEYEQTGIRFDPGLVRVERLEEAVQIIKGLFAQGPVTFSGTHYAIKKLEGPLKPLQQPHLPLLIGGASRRILSLAAREAAIVGLAVRSLPGTTQLERMTPPTPSQQGQILRADSLVDVATATREAIQRKIEWVRQAAGERFSQLELQVLVAWVAVSNEREAATQALGQRSGMTAEQILKSPYCLVGTVNEICETLKSRREEYGVSYLTVFEEDMEAFAPVVARLGGS